MSRIEKRRQKFFEKYKRARHSPGDWARRIILERERKRVPVYPIPLTKWYKVALKEKWKGRDTKLPFYCSKHGYVIQRAGVSFRGFSCGYCSNKLPITLDAIFNRIKQIHVDKYLYLPFTYRNVNSYLHIYCRKCNNMFWQSINSHINGKQGCPFCAGHAPLTLKSFYEKARIVHKDKYVYLPSLFNKVKDKIHILCTTCGKTFWQEISGHIYNKYGCPYCAGNVPIDLKSFITRVREIHGDKYTYMPNYWRNNKDKIHILCNICGNTFWQRLFNHRSLGEGCPYCYGNIKIDFSTFIKRARKVHGDNFVYMPNYWNNINEKIHIMCRTCGHIFWQAITSHINAKNGCPHCAKKQQTSKAEEEIARWVEDLGLKVERNVVGMFPDSRMEIDIWVPEKRLGIEFNGVYFHRVEKKGKDYHKNKTIEAMKAGIQLIHVFEDQWNEKPNKIKNAILFALGLTKFPFYPTLEDEIEINANFDTGCWLKNFGYVVDKWTEPCYIETDRGGYYDAGKIVWTKNYNVKNYWFEGM